MTSSCPTQAQGVLGFGAPGVEEKPVKIDSTACADGDWEGMINVDAQVRASNLNSRNRQHSLR